MFTKKFLSLVLATGLAIGFSLNAGALSVVDQDVLKIFNCENEEELKESFSTAAGVGIVNKSLKDVQSKFKANSKVCELCECSLNYYNVLRTSAAKSEDSADFKERDNVIIKVAELIKENREFKEQFKKQLDKLINGKTKHVSIASRSVRGKSRRHPGYGSLDG